MLSFAPALVHEFYTGECHTNHQWYDYDIGFWVRLIEGELWGIVQQNGDDPQADKFRCTPYRITIDDPDLLPIFNEITQSLRDSK
jgi:hypothetical protein